MPRIPDVPGPYAFFFYSLDCNERAHVHARRDRATCKFWLTPMELAANHGLAARDLAAVRRIIFQYRDRIAEVWHEHCGPTQK